jgi:hypothetical protein
MKSINRFLFSRFLTVLAVLGQAIPAAKAGDPPLPKELAKYDALTKPESRKHWAFQSVKRPTIPQVKDAEWVRNPIDAFVLARLEAQGWKPAPAAEPRAFLRRIYLDVIGVPPTPTEQEEFLRNSSPTEVNRVVESLLVHPAYGERWGRHWLDLVRFAETNGYERDATKPNVWRFRDYVIRAFNEDKPFDRFILEQLAGDELDNVTPETLIATGYYRLGPWDDEPADPQEDRFDQLDDMVNTTSQVFLGMTLACARCHNHKFEPLTMLDYYRMVAIFNPLERPQMGRDDVDLPIGSREELAEVERAEGQIADIRRLSLSRVATTIGIAATPSLWPGRALTWDCKKALKVSNQKIQNLRAATLKLPRGYFLREPRITPPDTHLLIRGKASRPGPLVPPGMPAVLVSHQPEFLSPGSRTTNRRLTLARWIASPENPLTARVIVNRVWQFHFGEGLVRSPSDFGVKGDPPTHPELLDWLADWFVHEGWSLKKLHALISSSNTYRMSKGCNAEYGEKDPEDRLLWRFPYHRLEAEAIRDSMLAVSGEFNPQMYGPSMFPRVPKQALEGHSDPDKIWKASAENEASRRTVYAFIKRSMVVPMLEVLDLCDTTRTSAKRSVTTVAPQALTLLNGDFVNRQAKLFARRLKLEAGHDPEKQIEKAYFLALCRPPSAGEKAAMLKFLKREADSLVNEISGQDRTSGRRNAEEKALEQMCRVIFNLNEFVYSD